MSAFPARIFFLTDARQATVSGWTRTSVKAGDRVKVILAPLKDSDNKGGLLKTLTLLDTGQSFSPNIRLREEPGLE